MNCGSSFNRGDSEYVNEQHSFALQDGSLIHTDAIARDTVKRKLATTDAVRCAFQKLYRN